MTYAKDYALTQTEDRKLLLDVQTFNKYYTFQIEKPPKRDSNDIYQPSRLSTRFTIKKDRSSADGSILRLRAELSSAVSDKLQQGMRISLIQENTGIIVDASSIDNNEGSVILQYDSLVEETNYTIRYDIYDKEILVSNAEIGGSQFSQTNTYCKQPFITQQLLIMDKRLVQHRVSDYLQTKQTNTPVNLQTQGLQCDLSSLNNQRSDYTMFEMEASLFCPPQVYTYRVEDTSEIKGSGLVKLYQQTFEVQGLNATTKDSSRQLITYWFELVVGLNFMASSSLKVFLSRNDHTFNENPYTCLFDKSCALAHMSEKNVLKMDLILTSGSYKLTFFETNSKQIQSIQELEKPISIKVQANTIIQNEERVNCPYMFIDETFIQNKFINDMNGQRFTFSDKLIMNVFNLTQHFKITPEQDSVLKVRTKEAFGVNMEISLRSPEGKILANSSQIGTTEVLAYSVLKKGIQYIVELRFQNSIIELSEFFSCPHFNLDVSLITLNEARQLASSHLKISDNDDFQSQSMLNNIFNSIEQLKYKRQVDANSYTFLNHSAIFRSNLEKQSSFQEITTQIFTVGPSQMQLFMEIYYDPYLLYDLELALYSKDAVNVRAHLNHNVTNIQWSLYKGSKQIFVELEPGEYELALVYKSPGISGSQNITELQIQSIQYQLQVIYAPKIDPQQVIPVSLNYFGMLGPLGQHFGQMVYYCQDCQIEQSHFKIIEFTLTISNISSQDINFNAIISSPENNVDVKLEKVPSNSSMNQSTYNQAFQQHVKKGQAVGSRMIRGSNEETITAINLQSSIKYRIVITVRSTDNDSLKGHRFNLRLEIQEKPRKPSQKQSEYLPSSIDEVARYKLKNEGEKDNDFIIASPQILKFIDESKLAPFIRKSDQIYQAKLKQDNYFHKMSFEIQDEEALVYVALFDFTNSQVSLGINIWKDDEEVQVQSIPGKYFTFIEPVTLSQGKYYLGIVSLANIDNAQDLWIQFSLDVLIEKENTTKGYSNELLESSMEFCGLPTSPRTLNWPEYLHPLSGNTVQTILNLKMSDFITGDSIQFELNQDLTMVQLYIEFSKDIQLEATLFKGYSIIKATANQDTLNQGNDNFLKTSKFKNVNIIQFRQVLSGKGMYRIQIKSSNSDLLDSMQRCDTLKLGIIIQPVQPSVANAKLSNTCLTSTEISKELSFAQDQQGFLQYSLETAIFDTTYITTQQINGDGPYLFYFQATYDTSLEGPLALILYRYDKDTLTFDEIQTFIVQDSSTQILAQVRVEGTYLIALQSMTSTIEKYQIDSKLKNKDIPLFANPCLQISYFYYINSMDDQSYFHWNKISVDLIKELDQILPKINSCDLDILPASFPLQTGYDLKFNLLFKQKSHDIIDLMVIDVERILFKIEIYSSSKNNLNAYLYKNSTALQPPSPANSSISQSVRFFGQKILMTILTSQKRPYKLKIIYDTLDETEECPTYQMRVSLKPLSQVISENLKCSAIREFPPREIVIDEQPVFIHNKQYQIGSDVIENNVSLDIEIKVPSKEQEYYFDIEVKFDFLTNQMQGGLYIYNGSNLILIRNTQPLQSEDDKVSIIRLKIENVRELLSNSIISDKYILRLTFTRLIPSILKTIGSVNLLCFQFDLSIRVSKPLNKEDQYEAYTDSSENEVIRVRWSNSQQFYDPQEGKLNAIIEFKQNLELKMIKSQRGIYLDSGKDNIQPLSIEIVDGDQTSVIVTFSHEILSQGKCYNLKFSNQWNIFALSLTKIESKICTTKCQGCNIKGSKGCDENNGLCLCKSPYTGTQCRQCLPGFMLDESSMECYKISRCQHEGGLENCNDHGACYSDSSNKQAMCRCDQGFTDDGLERCGKCTDPMFSYPSCHQRQWMVLHNEYNCGNLTSKMPTHLYKSDLEPNSIVYQNQEGQAHWKQMYRLDHQTKESKSFTSSHYFKVPPGNGIFRMFFDTHNSGVQVNAKILNNQKRILYSSNQLQEPASKAIFLIIEEPEDPNDPFSIVIEYQYVTKQTQQCPLIELLVIIQPYTKIQEYLKCTQDQIVNSKALNRNDWYISSESSHNNVNYTIMSNDAFLNEDDMQIIKTRLIIDQQATFHALSILATYNFESILIKMQIRDIKTNSVIAFESLSYIEDMEGDQFYQNFQIGDMVSYIELPQISAGEYELELIIDKSLYLYQRKSPSCLTFDLSLEHVAIRHNSDAARYEVLTVIPSIVEHINPNTSSSLKIQVIFDKNLLIEELMTGGQEDVNNMCFLEIDVKDTSGKGIIYATTSILNAKNSIELYFNISEAWTQYDIAERCYHMMCRASQNNSLSQTQYIDDIHIKTRYCLKATQKQAGINQLSDCNPNAMPKLDANSSKCICLHPYKGSLCENCDQNFKYSQDNKSHTVCSLDPAKCTRDSCSNHGECINSYKLECHCDDLYSGYFCNKCKNRAFTYPDCDSQDTIGYRTQQIAHNQRYNQNGNEKLAINTNPNQCMFTNYPPSLDKIEFMGFLPQSGNFHIADYYSVNHDNDNFIRFTPRAIGQFKIMIQQPQNVQVIDDDGSFDIEIALYDEQEQKFLVTSVNQNLDHINGKLDFTILQYQGTAEDINRPLVLVFRLMNFTTELKDQQCETVYLEMQFQEGSDSLELGCSSSDESIQRLDNSGQVIRVDNSYKNLEGSAVYMVTGSTPQLFYHQDFYLGNTSSNQDYTIYISLKQKFMDHALINFIVEVLAYDVNETDHVNNTVEPKCEGICFIGGQKAYNEYFNLIEIGSKTLIRLWFFKHDQGCGLFQVQIEVNRTKSQNKTEQISCDVLDLPQSFNTERYLGNNTEQKSFHFLEHFRVDNLNSDHSIYFKLSEPTMVRVVAKLHKNLEFDLELLQTIAPNQTKRLIDSGAKGFEDSIYAQLDIGYYQLKLVFVSGAYFLNQHCQKIEMEIAFTSLSKLQGIKETKQGDKIQMNFIELITNYQNHENTILAYKGIINSYNLSDQLLAQNYRSFIQIYSQRFSVLKVDDVGLIINIESDFLTNDVCFALTQANTNHYYSHERFQNRKQLILTSLPGGDFDLLIFAHQSLNNLRDTQPLQNISAVFKIDIHFIYWNTQDDFKSHFLMLDVDKKAVKARLEVKNIEQYKCLQQFQFLPLTLECYNGDQIDISGDFMIPKFAQYEHLITFTPKTDSLRIIIERSNTLIKIRKNAQSQIFSQSFSINSDQQQILIVQDLIKDQIYEIIIQFDLDETMDEFESEICQSFKMQIQSLNSKSKSTKALSQVMNQDFISIGSIGQDSLIFNFKDLPTVNKTLHITTNNTDSKSILTIQIGIDYSELFFIPSVKLIEVQSQKTIQAIESDLSIKNLIRYKFNVIEKQQNYIIIVNQRSLANQAKIQIKTSILGVLINNKLQRIYTSQEQIQNRQLGQLPASLDTFKYLRNDNSYLLTSEYLALNSDDNRLTFTIDEDQTLSKFMIESDEIFMTLMRTGGQIYEQRKQNMVVAILQKGSYELNFETSILSHQTFKLLILIAQPRFIKDSYIIQQGQALKNCEGNKNFPLSLNKQSELIISHRSKDEIIYEYALLRLNGDILSTKTQLDRYAFRVNDTSRFYMTLGTHQLTSNARLRLSELKESGKSLIGNQKFNLNVLDYIVGPGDYMLFIEQSQTMESQSIKKIIDQPLDNCGLFSLSGRITPLQDVGNQIQQCQIRQVLPTKIYKQQSDTKDGLEDFINQDGTFIRTFRNLLQSHQSDSLVIESPDNGVLSILLTYKSGFISVSLKPYNLEKEIIPLFPSKLTKVSHGMMELNSVFPLQKGIQYIVKIQYSEQINGCSYYSAIIAYDTIIRMENELKCSGQKQQMLKDLPSAIQGQFTIQRTILVGGVNIQDTSKQVQIITEEVGIDIDVTVKFDYPYSLFSVTLLNSDNQDIALQLPLSQGDEYSPVVARELEASQLEAHAKYQVIIAEEVGWHIMKHVQTFNKSASLCLYADISISLNKQVKQSLGNTQPQVIAVYPSMGQIQHDLNQKYLLLENDASEVKISLTFSTLPYLKDINNNHKGIEPTVNQEDLSHLISLQRFHPKTDDLIYVKGPTSVVPNYSKTIAQQIQVTFTFDLKEEKTTTQSQQDLLQSDILLGVYFDINNTVDNKGQTFTMGKGLQLPKFKIEGRQSESSLNRRKQEGIYSVSGELDQNNKLEQPIAVDCICVHGQCRQGESKCFKCDNGWSGVLCNVPFKSSKINSREQKQFDNSKLQRNRNHEQAENMNFVSQSENKKTQNQRISFKSNFEVSQSKQEVPNFFKTFVYLAFNLILVLIVIGVLVYALYRFKQHQDKLRDYAPISLQDNEFISTELSDLRVGGRQSILPMNTQSRFRAGQPQNQQMIDHQDFEEQTKTLTNKLHLFSQDDIQQHQIQLVESNEMFNQDIMEATTNEIDIIVCQDYEIEDALKEMGDLEQDEYDTFF